MRRFIFILNLFLAIIMFGLAIFSVWEKQNMFIVKMDSKVITPVKATKKILLTVKIKYGIPIKTDINIKSKYYCSFSEESVFLFHLIRHLQLNPDYFDFTAFNLNQKIKTDYELILFPKTSAIAFYNRKTVFIDLLLNIGLNINDAKKILAVFHNENYERSEIEANLKAILMTKKRSFFHVINLFMVY